MGPWYLVEIHSETGKLFHILIHHDPNTGEIVLKFAICIVFNIFRRMEGGRGRYLDYVLHFWCVESKRGNVKSSYLIEIHSEIGALFHILVNHGPNTGEIDLKSAVYIVYDIGKRIDDGQRPLSRRLLSRLGPWKQTRQCQTIVSNRNTQRNRW